MALGSGQNTSPSGPDLNRTPKPRDRFHRHPFGLATGVPTLSDGDPEVASTLKQPRQYRERLGRRAQISSLVDDISWVILFDAFNSKGMAVALAPHFFMGN